MHSELFTLQYETTQGEKGPVVRPIILTAGFIERKVRNMVGGGGGRGRLPAFFLVIPEIPFAFTLTDLKFKILGYYIIQAFKRNTTGRN